MFLLGGGEEEIREEFKKKVAFELGLEADGANENNWGAGNTNSLS